MAVFTQKIRDKYNASNHKEFIMDGENESEDLAALPGIDDCAIGSIARHLKSKKTYIIDSTGQWVEYPFDEGGSSGGGGGGDEGETDYDWEDL